MKVFLTISFIVFSLFSTIVESQNFDLSESTAFSISNHDKSCNDSSNCSSNQKSCHDSNCYGSAHFGHGFYYQGKSSSMTFPVALIHSSVNFVHPSHTSLVYLENLFRPPLAQA